MAQDPELLRMMLIEIEKVEPGVTIYDGQLKIEGYTQEQIKVLLSKAIREDLVDGFVLWADDAPYTYMVKGLKPKGCQFLEMIRSDDGWNKAKKVLLNLGEFTIKAGIDSFFDMVKKVLLS